MKVVKFGCLDPVFFSVGACESLVFFMLGFDSGLVA